jgi:protein-tyrosine-phosphatase
VGSAGVRKEDPDPFVAAVMDEIGLDLSRHKPKSLEELVEYEDFDFDLVISLSPEAHHAALEFTRTHPVEAEYWPTEDPTAAEGNREQRLDAYRAVRDQLMKRIRERFAGGAESGHMRRFPARFTCAAPSARHLAPTKRPAPETATGPIRYFP